VQRAGLDTEKLMLCQPDSGEMALEVVDQTVRSNAVDIICVDSVAALVPRAEIEGEMGAHQGETDHLLLTLSLSTLLLLWFRELRVKWALTKVRRTTCCWLSGSAQQA